MWPGYWPWGGQIIVLEILAKKTQIQHVKIIKNTYFIVFLSNQKNITAKKQKQ